jgi:hypothetical protein
MARGDGAPRNSGAVETLPIAAIGRAGFICGPLVLFAKAHAHNLGLASGRNMSQNGTRCADVASSF